MLTYTFYHKNNSNTFTTSQDSAEDAWNELKQTVKDTWGWRLEDEEENTPEWVDEPEWVRECGCGQMWCPICHG